MAIESAKNWWKSEERYFRQAQLELVALRVNYGACMIIPTPFLGRIYLVKRVLFSVKEKEIIPTESQLRGLRKVYSGSVKTRWQSSKKSDCVIMLCNFNERIIESKNASGGLF